MKFIISASTPGYSESYNTHRLETLAISLGTIGISSDICTEYRNNTTKNCLLICIPDMDILPTIKRLIFNDFHQRNMLLIHNDKDVYNINKDKGVRPRGDWKEISRTDSRKANNYFKVVESMNIVKYYKIWR
jgi:hypothetical protein